MRVSLKCIALAATLACFGHLAPFAQAQNYPAQSYVENYVPIGSFQDPDGNLQVFMDLNQPRGSVAGVPNAAIKVYIPNQQYFDHHVTAADRSSGFVTQAGVTDTNAAYFSVLVGVDCARQIIHLGRAVYYNTEDQMLADHNYAWNSEPIHPNSLGSVVAQKVCGG